MQDATGKVVKLSESFDSLLQATSKKMSDNIDNLISNAYCLIDNDEGLLDLYELVEKTKLSSLDITLLLIRALHFDDESEQMSQIARKRYSIDPKQHAKVFVKDCWQTWQENPTNYKSKAAFARDMLDKVELSSARNITNWCREWEAEALSNTKTIMRTLPDGSIFKARSKKTSSIRKKPNKPIK